MAEARSWYASLTNIQRLKMLTITMVCGEEYVASALCDTNDIDALFDSLAQRIYGGAAIVTI